MSLLRQIKEKIEADRPYWVVFYGPSTVSFEYIFPNWPEIIRYVLKAEMEKLAADYRQVYWNIFTVNLGMSGATSADLLERKAYVQKMEPDLVFITSSKNDVYFGISPKQSGENSQALIEYFLKKQKKVIFLTSIPSLRDDLNQKIAPYVQADRKIANKFGQETNFLFIDLNQLFPQSAIKKSYTLLSEASAEVGIQKNELDPIHYNRYGNAMVAKIILKEAFGITFDPEKFLAQVYAEGIKYPAY